MKLEWTSMHFPRNPELDYYWEPGVIINFDTPEAAAKSLRMVDLYDGVGSYKDEFIVLKIGENKDMPKHLTGYFVELAKIKDGILIDKMFQVGYPTAVTNAAKWLRKTDRYTVIIEKGKDEEYVSEYQATHR